MHKMFFFDRGTHSGSPYTHSPLSRRLRLDLGARPEPLLFGRLSPSFRGDGRRCLDVATERQITCTSSVWSF